MIWAFLLGYIAKKYNTIEYLDQAITLFCEYSIIVSQNVYVACIMPKLFKQNNKIQVQQPMSIDEAFPIAKNDAENNHNAACAKMEPAELSAEPLELKEFIATETKFKQYVYVKYDLNEATNEPNTDLFLVQDAKQD